MCLTWLNSRLAVIATWRSPGSGWAAVMRYRRVVVTSFSIDQPVRFLMNRLMARRRTIWPGESPRPMRFGLVVGRLRSVGHAAAIAAGANDGMM